MEVRVQRRRDDQDVLHTEPVHLERQYINTTVGRAILNDHLSEGMPYALRASDYLLRIPSARAEMPAVAREACDGDCSL